MILNLLQAVKMETIKAMNVRAWEMLFKQQLTTTHLEILSITFIQQAQNLFEKNIFLDV